MNVLDYLFLFASFSIAGWFLEVAFRSFMVRNYKNNCLTGIDIGSTTVKVVICNNSGETLFSRYRRHNAMILDTILSVLKEAHDRMGNIRLDMSITGSAGMGVAESFGLPFIQEVVASAKLIKNTCPEVRTFIEIGGEDSKIVFFDDYFRPDIRMNGSCAAGTGAFIDQMAVLLDVPLSDLDELAGGSSSIYPIASRCGVFAKTDIQALLSNKVSRKDIAASVFHAVALQTIVTLARGSGIRKKVLFGGGPLKFFPQLQKAFVSILDLNVTEDVVVSNHPEFIPSIGTALFRDGRSFEIEIEKLIDLLTTGNLSISRDSGNRLSPLFNNPDEFKTWEASHEQHSVKKTDISRISERPCFLGVDSGSTTTKIVLIDNEGCVALTYYSPNNGDPVDAVRKGLKEFQEKFQQAGIMPRIVRTAATGYGEELVRAAFGIDDGIVETMAHYRAAKSFDFDLGTRCTVFMNSRVKQALREGVTTSDISAGLAYSVIKNSLYKVLKLKDPETLGGKIVAQGGTFRNPAVLRAFEILLGRKVIRPDISELMGAYGAALTALQNYRTDSSEISQFSGFDPFDRECAFATSAFHCKGCENRCGITRLTFENGRNYFAGNRCERYFSNGSPQGEQGGRNLVAAKLKLLLDRKMEPDKLPVVTFGIPRVLNMYENFPFWCTFLVECGFRVVLSDPSCVRLFEKGAGTVISDNICFPAKLAHGHIINLAEKNVDRIFYPIVVYESKEYSDALNSYNCPVVTGYPDVLRSSIDPVPL